MEEKALLSKQEAEPGGRDRRPKTVALRSSSNAGTSWEYYISGAEREARIFSDDTSSHVLNKEVSFYLYDHLGNTRVVYKVDGYLDSVVTINNIDFVADYFPYGKIVRKYVNGQEERFLTTQHERDEETGLDYRGARYYDSDVARFLSLDPLAAQYPAYSAYCYVMGNPVMLVDPTGMAAEDWVQKSDGSIYWDHNAKSQGTTKKGEKYLSASYYNIAVVDAIGDHIMRSNDPEKGYQLFIKYIERFGKDYFVNAARHHYETNATGSMAVLANNYKSVKDGIRISQMTHSWVDAAGWTQKRNQLEHWIGMFTLADKHGPGVANVIGFSNEMRGLLINDRQAGNVDRALLNEPTANGGPTAFEWKDLKYNGQGLDKWFTYRGYYSFSNMDLDGDGHLSVEENRIYNESKGGLGE